MAAELPITRADELGRLDGWLDQASARCLVGAIAGDAGIGKTTLLAAARTRALARGFTVLATQGRQADAELGFASLLTLLRPVERALDELAGDAAPDVRAALALGRGPGDPVGVHLGVFRILANLSARAPLLVAIDDAEHIDSATATALSFALGRLDADPVCALIASGDPPRDPLSSLRAESLSLDPLDDPALAAVVRERVELDAGVLQQVVRLACGNPLAALELAGSLTPAERAARAPFPPVPRPTAAVLHGFESRLAGVSEAARRALAVVAADDLGEIAVIAAALAQLGEAEAGLTEAEAAGLIERDATRVRLAHPLLRAVAYHQVAPASRRAAHRALAVSLGRPEQAAARAWQLAAAADGPDEGAAAALTLVAGDALRRGGPASAARTLERAAELSPEPHAAQHRLAQAVGLWARSDRPRALEVAARLGPPNDPDVAAMTYEALGRVGPAGSDEAGPRFAALRAEEALDRSELERAARLARACVDDGDPAASQLASAVLVDMGLQADVDVGAQPLGEGEFAAHAWRAARLARVRAGWLDDPGAAADDRASLLAKGRIHLLQGRARAAADLLRPLVELTDDDDAALLMATAELLVGRNTFAAVLAPRIEALEGRGAMRSAAEGWWLLGRANGSGEALQRAASLSPALYGADAVSDLVMSGQRDSARRLATQLGADASGGPLVQARTRRALAVAGIEPPAFLEALALCDDHGLVVEALEVLRARGAFDEVRARARLTDVRLFDGPVVPSLERTDLRSRLSAAEMRVAEAIAGGLTNRQASEALFLSIKTVDFHLQQIYRKLGIRSRTQLAVLVSQDGQAPLEVG